MDNNLTFNNIEFREQAGGSGKSTSRQSITRGINNPDILIIAGEVVKNKDGSSVQRYSFELKDRYTDATTGVSRENRSVYITWIPATSSQAEVDRHVATFRAIVAHATFLAQMHNGER